MSTEFSRIRHDVNNKIATLDASLSAMRIYLQRVADAGDNQELRQKATVQLQEISADMVMVSGQMQELIGKL